MATTDVDPSPLSVNPTLAQIRAHEEKKMKKDKVITYLHSAFADHVFTKIMDLETPKLVWDKLQGEFNESNRVKTVRILVLKKEFELMKMKDVESVKDYSGRLMDVMDKMGLLGKVIEDQKVVEKMMVSLPHKFEAQTHNCTVDRVKWYTKTRGAKFEVYVDFDLGQNRVDENPVQHDLMTKALPVARLEFLKMKLGLPKANLKEKC